MLCKSTFIIISILLCLSTMLLEADDITILYTGETHSALFPCDCAVEPFGGVARRATAIQKIRAKEKEILLLDAGGVFAGGIYDEYVSGYELDKKRTLANLEAMRLMGYDAICMGDEELSFGLDFLIMTTFNFPFLSVNAVYANSGALLLKPYLIKNIKGVKVAVLGVTTPEIATGEFKKQAEHLQFLEPISTLRKYVHEAKSRADIIVVLSHLGEGLSVKAAEDIPDIDVLINAHRKLSQKTYSKTKNAPVLQFNFQARKLGKLTLHLDRDAKIKDYTIEEISLSENIKDDEQIATLLTEFKEETKKESGDAKVRLDLYVMSQCAYGMEAERTVYTTMKDFGFVSHEGIHPFETETDVIDVNLYFIVNEKDGKLTSLHGQEELEEDMLQVCIARYFPDRFWDYLFWRNEGVKGMPWHVGAKKFGLYLPRINGCLKSGEAEEVLRSHAMRTKRLRIQTSPTVYINNQFYSGPIARLNLTKAICAQLPKALSCEPCQKLPECFTDKDCEKKGFVGICEDANTPRARCSYKKPVDVPLTVITDKRARFSNEADIVASTKTMFPGISVKYVDINSEKGKKLSQQYGIENLPAYIFGAEILKTHNFHKVKTSLRYVAGKYVPLPEMVGATIYVKRQWKPAQIDLFISCLSERANFALQKANKPTMNLQIHYIAYEDTNNSLIAQRGVAEIEEAKRQLIIKKYHDEKYCDYIKAKSRHLGSSYWEDALLEVGLNPAEIKRLAKSPEAENLLRADTKLVKELDIAGDVAFLLDNREVIVVQSRMQLEALLKGLSDGRAKR